MPRSLYARAALILLVPVLTIQIVVSVVFIQRLYEDVTEQMTRNVLLEVRHLASIARRAPDRQTALARIEPLSEPLSLDVAFVDQAPDHDSRLWDDLSGRVVIATLRERLDGVLAIDLATDDDEVAAYLATPHGPMSVTFDRRRVSASNPHQLLVLMGFTSLLMTVVAYLFLRNQLRPVKQLAGAAEAFGRGRAVPFKPAGATEMRAAGSAFLDMRNRIERMIEQRTLMLSAVSHDLRTPLTRLKLALSLAEEDDETRAMQRDVNDMERLVDTFLDFARGEALDDKVEIEPEALLRAIVDRAQRAGQPVELGQVKGGARLNASALAVERALDNLVGNAVRYGSRAVLSLASGDRSVRFTVEDDGPGIPPGLRDEATRPFARLDRARNQDRGTGVGLGLAIANDIARRHGGALRLGRSERLGGLRVDLVLPR